MDVCSDRCFCLTAGQDKLKKLFHKLGKWLSEFSNMLTLLITGFFFFSVNKICQSFSAEKLLFAIIRNGLITTSENTTYKIEAGKK